MNVRGLRDLPLSELQTEAFRIRTKYFGNELTFAVPGVVSYETNEIPGQQSRFAALSVTGSRCDLQCAHCKGKLLASMIPANSPEVLLRESDRLRSSGALGILISGGADKEGGVPLKEFVPAIRRIKEMDHQFKVIVHTGLIHRQTAVELKEAGVDQVLIDVIGHDDTIREIYRLKKHVEDYEEILLMLKQTGLRLAPHIIIGHHLGELKGEWKAIEMVSRIGVDSIVLVIFKPILPQRPVRIPTPEEASRLSAAARILNPSTPIRMGCIRPAHSWKGDMEKGFIKSGVNTIAYPLQGTIDYAKEIGLKTKFVEMCCSLV